MEFSQPNRRKCRRLGTLSYTCSAGVVEPGKLHPKLWGSWGLPWVCQNLRLEGGSAATENPCAQPYSGMVCTCRGDNPRAWKGDGPSVPTCPPAPCPWGSAEKAVLLQGTIKGWLGAGVLVPHAGRRNSNTKGKVRLLEHGLLLASEISGAPYTRPLITMASRGGRCHGPFIRESWRQGEHRNAQMHFSDRELANEHLSPNTMTLAWGLKQRRNGSHLFWSTGKPGTAGIT